MHAVSIASFGMLAGSLIAGPLANLVGRKWASILGTCSSLALGYALMPFAQHLWMMLLARFMMGAGLGFSTALSTLYVMEIATPEMRSGLAVVPAVAGTLGLLSCQLLGAMIDWQPLSLVLACFNVPFFLLLIFIPETPVYLLGTEQVLMLGGPIRKATLLTIPCTDRAGSQGAAHAPRQEVGRDEGADRFEGGLRGHGKAPRRAQRLHIQLGPEALPHGAHPYVLLSSESNLQVGFKSI